MVGFGVCGDCARVGLATAVAGTAGVVSVGGVISWVSCDWYCGSDSGAVGECYG